MDVVTLPSEDDNDPAFSVVTDDLIRMVNGKSKHGAIYCVFVEDVTLTEPFKLFHYKGDKEVTRLDARHAQQHGLPMWSERSRESPNMQRYKHDYIKLNFFQGQHGRNDGVIFTWTDFSMQSNGQPPSPSKLQHLRSSTRSNMNLYMLLPFAEKCVQVMSEKAFGSYLLMQSNDKIVQKNTALCTICRSNDQVKIMLDNCGHVYCQQCWHAYRERGFVKCPNCNTREVSDKELIRLKCRHGPCPVDMCIPKDDTYGVVLVPCGCRIRCEALENASKKDVNNLLRIIQSCPYDACKKHVTNILNVRG